MALYTFHIIISIIIINSIIIIISIISAAQGISDFTINPFTY